VKVHTRVAALTLWPPPVGAHASYVAVKSDVDATIIAHRGPDALKVVTTDQAERAQHGLGSMRIFRSRRPLIEHRVLPRHVIHRETYRASR
jgi:hypothetical protein